MAVQAEYMDLHFDTLGIERRLLSLVDSHVTSRSGKTFRMVNPKWTKDTDIISGRGALKEPGRWNLNGIGYVTYSSFSPETALTESLEAVRYFGFPDHKGLPKVLVTLIFDFCQLLDLTDGEVRQKLKLGETVIRTTDWRAVNLGKTEAVTQAVGRCALKTGLEGLMVPSVADPAGTNLVVFPRNMLKQSVFKLARSVHWPK